MNKIEEIVRRINRIIDIEVGITKRERDEYEEKKHSEASYWGVGGNSDIIDCPVCMRTLYRAGNYTTWKTIRGSRHTELHDH